mmetsp:Transcript_50886/g.164839  ORF Transcript_50886/g.164839 Transcript_50886/m.164839 type:complete len:251 (-) Transcript_50886:359-1111(-)
MVAGRKLADEGGASLAVGADIGVGATVAALLVGAVVLVREHWQADELGGEEQGFIEAAHRTHDVEGGEHLVELLPCLLRILRPRAAVHAAIVLGAARGHAACHDRRLQVGHLRRPLAEVVAPHRAARGRGRAVPVARECPLALAPARGERLFDAEGDAPAEEGEVVVERLAHARHEDDRAVYAVLQVEGAQRGEVLHRPVLELDLPKVRLDHEQQRGRAALPDRGVRQPPHVPPVRVPAELRIALVQAVA